MILQLLFKPENAVFMRVCKGFENQGKGMKTVFVEPVTPTRKKHLHKASAFFNEICRCTTSEIAAL